MAGQRTAKNFVRGETNTLELANLGHAVNLRVYRDGKMKGRMLVGHGAIGWIPRGWTKAKRKSIPWNVFAVMMKEWPFGSRAEASLKFVDGALRWRSPGKRGAGRKVSWAELTARMEAPMTEDLRAGVVDARKLITEEREKARLLELEKKEEKKKRDEAKRAREEAIARQKEEDAKRARRRVLARRKAAEEKRKAARARAREKKREAERKQAESFLIEDLRESLGDMCYVSCPVDNGDILRLKRPPRRGPNGNIDVSLNDRPGGWIDDRGYYWPAWDDRRLIERTVADLKSFVANSEAWIEHTWKGENRCVICGYKLTNPLSKKLGMGPWCRKEHGSLEVLTDVLAKRAAARRRATKRWAADSAHRRARAHPRPKRGIPPRPSATGPAVRT